MSWKSLSKFRTEIMGFTCLWIMLHHNIFDWPKAFYPLQKLANYGNLGVDIFLLLSGVGSGAADRAGAETFAVFLDAAAFIDEQEYTFPVVYDTNSDAAMSYGAYSLPTTFFIDAEGYAIAQAVGAIDGATLQRGIDLIYSAE